MPKLDDATIDAVKNRIKTLGIVQADVGKLLKIHPNTINRALNGHSVNRNNLQRINGFADGSVAAVVELGLEAAGALLHLANEAQIGTSDFCDALVRWVETQTPPYRLAIRDSVKAISRPMKIYNIHQVLTSFEVDSNEIKDGKRVRPQAAKHQGKSS